MGGGISKENVSHIEIASAGSQFITERDEGKISRVIYQHRPLDVHKNGFFSKDSFRLKGRNEKLTLKINGAAVIRIGLVDTNPDGNRWNMEDLLFKEEDAFDQGCGTRSLYINNIRCVCYGEPEQEQEYTSINNADDEADTGLWLIISVVYGQPTITATRDNQPITWSVFQDTNIDLQNSSTEAHCGLKRNSEMCLISDPIDSNVVYHIDWDMRLEEEEVLGAEPRYGCLGIAILTAKPTDLSTFTFADNHVAWFTRTAVKEYPFSGVIAFKIDINENQIIHNLLMTSVEQTKKEFLKLDETNKQTLYLAMEVSSGEVAVSHVKKSAGVRQEHGSLYYVTDYELCDSCHEVKNSIVCKSGSSRPCRIQFGSNPTAFIVEFNKKLNKKVESAMKREVKMVPVKETSTIQVMDIPSDIEDHDVEEIFSREQLGGGHIKSLEKEASIKGTWLITYSDIKDARCLWMKGVCHVDDYTFKILPYFSELGCAVNYGDSPAEIDTSVLVMKQLNSDKMNFIKHNDNEKKKFEEKMQSEAMVQVLWMAGSDDGFEDCDDEYEDNIDNSITFECKVPVFNYKKLATWKANTEACVNEYFANSIIVKEVQIEPAERWDPCCTLLSTLKETKCYDFILDKASLTVKLISSNAKIIDDVAKEIGKVIPPQKQVTGKVSISHITLKYQALSAERKLTKVESENPNTSFMIDSKQRALILKGPKTEVERAEKDILTLTADTVRIAVILTDEKVTILKTDEGRQLLKKQLCNRGLNTHFAITGDSCCLWVCSEDSNSEAQKKEILQNAIQFLFKTNTVEIPKAALGVLNDDTLQKFKVNEESLSNSLVVFIIDNEKVCVNITGTCALVDKYTSELKHLFKINSVGQEVMYMSRDIIDFIVHVVADPDDKYEFPKDNFGECTGQVLIKGDAKEIQKLKEDLIRETVSVKTFWFYVKRQWLASIVNDLTIVDTLARNKRCMLQAEIADSFADRGVPIVAILPGSGAVIQVMNGDIIWQKVDSIVNAANDTLEHDAGLSKAIVSEGGSEIQRECKQHVVDKGKVAVGEVFVSGPGRLSCRRIVHAVGPKWTGGTDNEEATLKCLVRNILKKTDANKHVSVVIPALCCGSLGYPAAMATTHIVQAVDEFLMKNKTSTIKEVYLCDRDPTAVDKFKDAVQNVLKGTDWFVFEHKRQRSVPKGPRPKSSRNPRKETMRWGANTEGASDLSRTMRWGAGCRVDPASSTRTVETPKEDDSLSEDKYSASLSKPRKTNFDHLPFKIPISHRTCLHVIKGTIETQKTDIIVNTTPQFPNLTGAVSNALDKASGGAIMADCKHINRLDYGEVKITPGTHGSLDCKHIYHVLTEMGWNPHKGYDHVFNIVKTCLTEANNVGCQSIAFPAIGTGASHFPADKVADAMVKALCEFTSLARWTSVRDMYIVVYIGDSGTCQIFEQEIPRLLDTTATNVDDQDIIKEMKKANKDNKRPAGTHHTGRPVFSINPAKKPPKAMYRAPAKTEDHSIADDVVFVKVISKCGSDEIQKQFKELVESEFVTKTVDFGKIKELSLKEETALQNVEKTIRIKIQIDKTKCLITLVGLRKYANEAESEVGRLLNQEFQEWRLKGQLANRIKESVEWCYDDHGTLKQVPVDSNFEIHMGYLKGKDFTYTNSNDGRDYKVIVDDLEEHPVNEPFKRRRLFQRAKVNSEHLSQRLKCVMSIGLDLLWTKTVVPHHWSIAQNKGDTALVQLQPHDPEFNVTKNKFLDDGCPATQILKITRIEDRHKWLQLEAKKKQMKKQNSQNTTNERSLWHGTDIDTEKKIIDGGYDRSFCGKHATVYGEGAYFATTSRYSHRYAAADNQGVHRMFLNKVLTGRYTQGYSGLKYLPERDPTNKILFDSAVDVMKAPTMFIIFHDTQAYPEYLIEYK